MLDITFNVKFEGKELLKACKVGILEQSPLKSWKKETKNLSDGLKANKKINKNFGDKTVADSFASVVKGTPLLKYMQKVFANQKSGELVKEFILDPDRNVNNIAGLVQQAYVEMAKKEKNSSRRVLQKGHDNYAIGTGQTLQEIGAEIE